MFRPRPNAAGGSSKDAGQGAAASVSSDINGTPATADGVINESQASLPGIGEESFISKMMADKYVSTSLDMGNTYKQSILLCWCWSNGMLTYKIHGNQLTYRESE
jgi:hypothetical protein